MNDQPAEVVAADVIQIGPHPTIKPVFHYKLAFVDEVKGWGVLAYVATFEGDAYIRLAWGTFEVIGPAAFMRAAPPSENV